MARTSYFIKALNTTTVANAADIATNTAAIAALVLLPALPGAGTFKLRGTDNVLSWVADS